MAACVRSSMCPMPGPPMPEHDTTHASLFMASSSSATNALLPRQAPIPPRKLKPRQASSIQPLPFPIGSAAKQEQLKSGVRTTDVDGGKACVKARTERTSSGSMPRQATDPVVAPLRPGVPAPATLNPPQSSRFGEEQSKESRRFGGLEDMKGEMQTLHDCGEAITPSSPWNSTREPAISAITPESRLDHYGFHQELIQREQTTRRAPSTLVATQHLGTEDQLLVFVNACYKHYGHEIEREADNTGSVLELLTPEYMRASPTLFFETENGFYRKPTERFEEESPCVTSDDALGVALIRHCLLNHVAGLPPGITMRMSNSARPAGVPFLYTQVAEVFCRVCTSRSRPDGSSIPLSARMLRPWQTRVAQEVAKVQPAPTPEIANATGIVNVTAARDGSKTPGLTHARAPFGSAILKKRQALVICIGCPDTEDYDLKIRQHVASLLTGTSVDTSSSSHQSLSREMSRMFVSLSHSKSLGLRQCDDSASWQTDCDIWVWPLSKLRRDLPGLVREIHARRDKDILLLSHWNTAEECAYSWETLVNVLTALPTDTRYRFHPDEREMSGATDMDVSRKLLERCQPHRVDIGDHDLFSPSSDAARLAGCFVVFVSTRPVFHGSPERVPFVIATYFEASDNHDDVERRVAALSDASWEALQAALAHISKSAWTRVRNSSPSVFTSLNIGAKFRIELRKIRKNRPEFLLTVASITREWEAGFYCNLCDEQEVKNEIIATFSQARAGYLSSLKGTF